MEYIITYTESSKAKVIKHKADSLNAVIALCELKKFTDYKVFADVQALMNEVERLRGLIEEMASATPDVETPKAPALDLQESQGAVPPKQGNSGQRILVYLLNKRFIPACPELNQYSDRITFSLEFANGTGSVVRALKGSLVFKDLFDAEIFRIGLTVNNRITPGDTVKWDGGFEYNQFLDEHQHFLQFEAKDLKVSLENLQIVGA